MASGMDRRTFLKTTSATAAGVYAARSFPAWANAEKSLVAVATPLTTFAYSDVQLHDGPMKRQFEENHARFLNLDDDRMLKVFRQVAGLSAPGEDMGGWYDLTGFSLEANDFHGFIAGHSFGQYVSGLARAYAVTGSEPTRAKINRLVKGYGETLDPKAKFFVDYRLPAYTYDKLSCGLIDAHEYAHDPMAMDIHEKLTRAIVAYLPEKALSRAEQRSRPHKDTPYTWDETYTLPENLFLAYQRSGKSFYRDMAKKYLEDDTYFDPSRGRQQRASLRARVQSRQCLQFGDAGIYHSRQRETSASGEEWLRHAGKDPELCDGRLGPKRSVRRAWDGTVRQQPDPDSRQL